MKLDYKSNRDWMENLQIVMQIGLTMVGCIAFCFYIGWLIDKWLETRGIFITVFTILGIIGGANVSYRQILDITEKGKARDGEDHSDTNGID